MDFLDPKKRRAHQVRLFIGYALMSIALLIGTWILVKINSGYWLDRKTGTIIQNGLVFVDAHPDSATVYLNGQNKGSTATRLTIPAGQYTLELKRDGYRPWQRGFTLSGAGVERFSYPFLFPEKLVTKDTDLLTAAAGLTTESPDRHWLVVEQAASLTNFDQIDLNATDNTVATLTFPTGLFTTSSGDQHIELVEWSTDNRHLLVKHVFDGGTQIEFVILDRDQPASSVNLTKSFSDLTMSDVRLHDKRFDQLYFLNAADGTLSTLDTKARTTAVAASHVASFKPYGSDQLLYITQDGAPAGQVVVKLKDGINTYTLHPFPSNTTYLLEMADFNGSRYALVGAASEGKVYEYKDPASDFKKTPSVVPIPIALLKVDNPTSVSFSQNTRFAEVQGGSKFAVYDAETDRQYRYDTKLNLDPPAIAKWMDGHRLLVVSGGKLVVFDYDGTNLQTLSPALPGYDAFFDRDYAALFTVGPSVSVKDHTAITRTELKVK